MDFALDRLLNFPYTTVERCRIEEKILYLSVGFLNEFAICPHCRAKSEDMNQKRALSIRDLPILGKATILEIERRQYYCQDCQKYFTESLEFIDFDRHTTNRYKEYIYARVKNSTITQIAREEDLTYDRVKSIFEDEFGSKKKSYLLQER
jgi:transposase